MWRASTVIAIAVVALTVTGAGIASTNKPSSALSGPTCPAGATVVNITEYAYTPQFVGVTPGATVCWTNQGTIAHTVTSDTGLFDSGLLVHPTVLKRFAAAVVIHGLWNTDMGRYIPYADFSVYGVPLFLLVLVVVGWYLVFAVVKQALTEVRVEKDRALRAAQAAR